MAAPSQGPFFLTFTILGGLALFLLGMNMMADGLRAVAGDRLREVLAKAGKNRFRGLAAGTLSGALIHSSASTVMLVAFVNAGLLTALESIPMIFGANFGTTLSMQLVSFKLGHYCFFAIASGFLLRLLGRSDRAKGIGAALMGFGLLFLGMNIMSDAVRPYRDDLQPLLQHANALTIKGLLLGLLAATAVTTIIQSSGATVGMCFALISAGALPSVANAYPILLGAHLGTCITALLGSIGTTIEAKRCALSHLMFNVIATLLALPLVKPLIYLAEASSSNLMRQTANLNTLLTLIGVVALIPFCINFSRLIRWITPSKERVQMSFLSQELIPRPEQALHASVQELQRMVGVCERSFRLTGNVLLLEANPSTVREVHTNRNAIHDIKMSLQTYMATLTQMHLAPRQALMLQLVDTCAVEIEGISNHITEFCDHSWRRKKLPQAIFGKDTFRDLCDLFSITASLLSTIQQSFDIQEITNKTGPRKILLARNEYLDFSEEVSARFINKLAQNHEASLAGLFYRRYIASLDRIVRHARIIAWAQQQGTFNIQPEHMGQVAQPAAKPAMPSMATMHTFRNFLRNKD